MAKYKVFSIYKFEVLKRFAIEKQAKIDFLSIEIKKILSTGYQHINYKIQTLKQTIKVQKVQGSPMGFSTPSFFEEEKDKMLE